MCAIAGLLASLCGAPVALAGPFDDFNIYFVNGINNSRDEAENSQRMLKQLVLPDAPSANIDKLYNTSEGVLADLLEAYRLAGVDKEFTNFWQWLDKPNMAPEWFQAIYYPTLAKYNESLYTQDPDLQLMLSKLKAKAQLRKKTILVAHSEGNFYANMIANNLRSSPDRSLADCVGIVAVATPATYVSGGGPYTTLANDFVINRARARFPWGANILPPSPPTPVYSGKHGGLGHEFVASYIEPPILTGRIRNQILDVANKLNLSCTMPCPTELLVPGTYTFGNWSKDYVWTVGAGTHNIIGSFITNRTYPNVAIFAKGMKLWGSDASITNAQSFNFPFDASAYGTTELVFQVAQTGIYNSGFNLCAGCGAQPVPCYVNLLPPPPPPPPVAKTISFNFTWTNNSQWSCDSGDAVVDGTISLGKIGYNGSKTVSLTPGAHSIVFTGTPYLGCTCLNRLGCSFGSVATYTVRDGYAPLATATLTQRYTQTISFTVP